MSDIDALEWAARVAVGKTPDNRCYRLGALGFRADQAIVWSKNGCPPEPEFRHHAEFRLSRKLTPGSVVYVARVKADNTWALAKPCPHCEKRLRMVGVSRVYYTLGEREYGCLIL